MAIGDIRCEMVFKEFITGRNEGWKELHYNTTKATDQAAMVDLKVLARARADLLGAGVELQGLKVSDDSIWRDSQVDSGPIPRISPQGPYYNPNFNEPGSATDFYPADFGYSSLLVRLQSSGSPLYRRSMWLSGNPDVAQDIRARDSTVLPVWNAAWTAFSRLLVPPAGATNWGFRVKSRDPGLTFETLIADIDEASGVLIFPSLDPAFLVGSQVVLRNVRGLVPSLAGQYFIAAIDTVLGSKHVTLERVGTAGGGEPLSGAYTATGYMRLLVFETRSYGKLLLKRFGSKKRGGPTTRAHGKRRTRPAVVG